MSSTFAIWLLAENLINDNDYIHDFKMRSLQGLVLCEHGGGIWLVELNKFKNSQIENEQQRWIKFFQEGEKLNDNTLPDWMQTKEMKQAMNTLSTFSEKQREYDRYQARMEYIRVQNALQDDLLEVRVELEAEKKLVEEEKQHVEEEKQHVAEEKQRVAEEKQRVAEEKQRVAEEKQRVAEEKQRIAAEKQRAEAQKQRADAEKLRADQEKSRAESALAELEQLKALLAKKN